MLRNDRPGAPISRAVGSAIDVAAFHRPPEDRSDILALSTALPRGRTAGSASCVCSLPRAHEAFGPPRQIPLSRLRGDCEAGVAREVCISTRAGDESPHVTPLRGRRSKVTLAHASVTRLPEAATSAAIVLCGR